MNIYECVEREKKIQFFPWHPSNHETIDIKLGQTEVQPNVGKLCQGHMLCHFTQHHEVETETELWRCFAFNGLDAAAFYSLRLRVSEPESVNMI